MTSDFDSRPAQPRQDWALVSYVAAIRARRWLVLLVTVAALVASIAFVLWRSPDYASTADILVEPISQEDQLFLGLPVVRDTGDPVRTVQTAASLVESQAAADLAAKEFAGDLSADQILESVEVNAKGESNILEVTATAGSPDEAADLANAFVAAALKVRGQELSLLAPTLIDQLEARLDATPSADQTTRAALSARLDQVRSVDESGDPTLTPSQEAVPPLSAEGASVPLILILVTMAGLVFGAGTAVLLELTTRKIRDEDDAVERYPLPVLARVPELSLKDRRGPADSRWFMPAAIREPFRSVALQLERTERPSNVVMVTSPSAGDGKTTSTINLAVSLAAAGKSVTVLDFDLRNPKVAAAFGIEGVAFSALFDTDLDLERLLERPSKEFVDLRFLAIRTKPDEVVSTDPAAWVLTDLIERARALSDYIIVDTAPLGLVSDALRLMAVVDDVLVVVRPGNTASTDLLAMRELIERAGHGPDGFVIIGSSEFIKGTYQAYGYGPGGSPDLIIRDPRPSRARARTSSSRDPRAS